MQHTSSTPELPEFMQQQYAFAARIRDPQHAAAPADVPARRMAVYEELFYNNIQDFLANAFPVIRKIHDDEQWYALVRDYFSRHRAHTPLFHEMPREFLHYLDNERDNDHLDYPFLRELAHYEWIELELLTAEGDIPNSITDTNPLHEIPLLSPFNRLLDYRYAVHKIGPDYLPASEDETPTHLLVYRDNDDVVGFIELNPVTARLLQLINEKTNASGQQLLEQIAAELHHPNPQTVIAGGRGILADLQQRGIIFSGKPRGEV